MLDISLWLFWTVSSSYEVGIKSTHTHIRLSFNDPLSGTTRVSRYQKGKTTWILLKQETMASAGPYASLHLAQDR